MIHDFVVLTTILYQLSLCFPNTVHNRILSAWNFWDKNIKKMGMERTGSGT